MCNMGARQSENLSPFCFSLYINDDLENYLVQNDIKGVTILIENLETEMHTMLKLVNYSLLCWWHIYFFWEPKQHKSLIFSNMICENFILTLKKTKVLFFFKRSYYKKNLFMQRCTSWNGEWVHIYYYVSQWKFLKYEKTFNQESLNSFVWRI